MGIVLPLAGVVASQISGHLAPALTGSYTAIASYTVPSGGVSSINFGAIPQGYSHLQIRTNYTGSSVVNPQIRLNGDSGSNYSWHHLYGDGSTAYSNGSASASFMYFSYLVSTSYPASTVTDILDYSSTSKNKTVRTLSGSDANGSGEIALWSGSWSNSSTAVNSITLLNNGGNFAQYSSFTLYGIR
jgi:hypothetical protein